MGQAGEQSPALAVGDAFLGEIGVDRGGADADEHGEIMNVEAFGRAHVERGEGAQLLADEIGVHRAGGEDHRHRGALVADTLVAQDHVNASLPDRVLGLALDAVERVRQGVLGAVRRQGAIDLDRLGAHVSPHGLEGGVGQHRRFELQEPGLFRVLFQDIAEVSQPRLQTHLVLLAQGIDGRVGHLAEILAEEVMEPAIAVR